jgi:hypothetical protein
MITYIRREKITKNIPTEVINLKNSFIIIMYKKPQRSQL